MAHHAELTVTASHLQILFGHFQCITVESQLIYTSETCWFIYCIVEPGSKAKNTAGFRGEKKGKGMIRR